MEGEALINEEELLYFNTIKDKCDIVFDIGCREDISYLQNSNGKSFYLFEPNPIFYNTCKEKLNLLDDDNNVVIENFGLGGKNNAGDKNYYSDSQSFLKRSVHFVSTATPIKLKIIRFSDYLKNNKIKKIDFLKIDTEGCEPDILFDDTDFVKNNIQYIQFEYASTWLDRDDSPSILDVFYQYFQEFDFYILKNKEHPLSKNFDTLLTEVKTVNHIKIIDEYMKSAYGFEIIMQKIQGDQ
jgi:FkbM family methyltransferase